MKLYPVSPLKIHGLDSGTLRFSRKSGELRFFSFLSAGTFSGLSVRRLPVFSGRKKQIPDRISCLNQFFDTRHMIGIHMGGDHIINLRYSVILQCRRNHILTHAGTRSASSVDQHRLSPGQLKQNTVSLSHIEHSNFKPPVRGHQKKPETEQKSRPHSQFPAAAVPNVKNHTFQRINRRHLHESGAAGRQDRPGQLPHLFQKKIKKSEHCLRRQYQQFYKNVSGESCTSFHHTAARGPRRPRRQQKNPGNPGCDSADHHRSHRWYDQKIDKNTVRGKGKKYPKNDRQRHGTDDHTGQERFVKLLSQTGKAINSSIVPVPSFFCQFLYPGQYQRNGDDSGKRHLTTSFPKPPRRIQKHQDTGQPCGRYHVVLCSKVFCPQIYRIHDNRSYNGAAKSGHASIKSQKEHAAQTSRSVTNFSLSQKTKPASGQDRYMQS